MKAGALPVVAYLTGEYPRATDTFIRREVAALRQLGFEVWTYSVRRPPDSVIVSDEQAAERDRTGYLLPASVPELVRSHLGLLTRSPRRYRQALALAWKTRRHGVRGTLLQGAYLLEAGILVRRLRAARVDHLHNHFGDSSGTVTMLASELSGIPFSMTLHGPDIFFEPKEWRLGEKVARSRFCCCISSFCRSQVAAFSHPDHLDRLRVVHCGVESLGRPPEATATDGSRLLFVGRLDRIKGLGPLLEAVADLHRQDRPLTLMLVGDGPDRQWAEQRAADLGIGTAVEFLGYRSPGEIADLLAAADIFVLPSFAEGVPVVLMEAMAAHLPVVTTSVGGITELVEHGRSGLVVPPGDVDRLVDAIAELADDPARRVELGRHGRSVVEREYNSTIEAARLATLLLESADGTGPAPRRELRPQPFGGVAAG
jgi:colanic acid/amylovoran biosynthesis glycosyltransferase